MSENLNPVCTRLLSLIGEYWTIGVHYGRAGDDQAEIARHRCGPARMNKVWREISAMIKTHLQPEIVQAPIVAIPKEDGVYPWADEIMEMMGILHIVRGDDPHPTWTAIARRLEAMEDDLAETREQLAWHAMPSGDPK